MKSSLVLSFVAALAFAASNVQAQEQAAAYAQGEIATTVAAPEAVATDAIAPATVAETTVVPTGDCQDCSEVGMGGIGLGAGIGGRFGGIRGGFGAGGMRARFDQRAAERNDRIGRERQIVQASPFANPTGEAQDWARFRNYPYGYYPHNFGPSDMRIPGYNPAWQNYYPTGRRYHQGQHFNLDVF